MSNRKGEKQGIHIGQPDDTGAILEEMIAYTKAFASIPADHCRPKIHADYYLSHLEALKKIIERGIA